MPMSPSELSELTGLIAAARKKPLNFGLCIGKKPDSMILYFHRKKAPEILARLAKKAGDTSKVAMGTVSISGKKMTFSLIGDPPSGLAKRTKIFLTSIKSPFLVELLNETGAVIGDEGDQPEDANAPAAPAATKDASAKPPAPSKEEIAAFKDAYALAQKEIKRLKRLKVDISALTTDLAKATSLAKGKKYGDATTVLAGMKPKVVVAEKAYCDRKKKQARDAITLVASYFGAALEVPKLEALFKTLEALCGKSPVDSKKMSAIVKAITRREKQIKRSSKKYAAEYKKLLKELNDGCTKFLPQLKDPIITKEYDAIVKGIALVKQKLEEHSPTLAKKLILKFQGQVYDAYMLVKAKKAYLTLRSAVESKLSPLYANRAHGIEKDCKRLEAKEKEALDFEKKRAFYDSTLIMNQIDGEVAGLASRVRDYKLFEKTKGQLQAQLQIIKKSDQYEFVVPEFNALLAKFKIAISLAQGEDIGKAINQLISLTTEAKTLEVKASKAAPFTNFEKEIDTGEIEDLRKQAEALLAGLQGHPRAKLAPHLLAEVKKHVEALDTFWNEWIPPLARKELKIISGLANEARKKLDNADAFYSRAVTLGTNTAQLGKTHAQAAYIKPFLVKIGGIVKKAKADALASAAGIGKALTEGEQLLTRAKTTADAEVVFRTHRTKTETSVTALSAPAVDFVGKVKALKDIKTYMEAADAGSKAFKHADAEKALGMVDTIVMTSNIGATAKTGTPPSKADIKTLLDQPDGQKALDDLVAALPSSTQQDVMINIMEVRFGMDVNVYTSTSKEDQAGGEKSGAALNVPAPKLLEYYEVLKSVPASHTKLNPSLMRFDSVEEDEGGWYSSGEKRAVIEMKDDGDLEMDQFLNDPKELDNVDPDSVCPPAVDEPTQASWTAYHEIGHAVDDRKSFMDGKSGDAAYGGWVEYGSNITAIAAAAAKHFEFDPSFVERALAGGSPKTPKVPPKLAEKEGAKAKVIWKKRQKDFEKWQAAVSVGNDPWEKASVVNTHKIGDVMYQEAYANNWVSYKVSARSKGVTGYQFRAPGEWFAELYAAYHTKKLNTSHPAITWLESL